ncbi:hypothetical protein M9458_053961, partial [Cirrhinus mrigala]
LAGRCFLSRLTRCFRVRQNVKRKKNEEEQKKRQRGALQKFLSGSRPTAVNLLESAEPEAEPGPETRPEDAVEDAAGNAAEVAVAPSTSAPSQKDKLMEEQQPARSEPNIVLNTRKWK